MSQTQDFSSLTSFRQLPSFLPGKEPTRNPRSLPHSTCAVRALPGFSPILFPQGGDLVLVLIFAFLQGCQKSGWRSLQPPASPALPTPALLPSANIWLALPARLEFWAEQLLDRAPQPAKWTHPRGLGLNLRSGCRRGRCPHTHLAPASSVLHVPVQSDSCPRCFRAVARVLESVQAVR